MLIIPRTLQIRGMRSSTQSRLSTRSLNTGHSYVSNFDLVSYMCERLNAEPENLLNIIGQIQNQQKLFRETSNESVMQLEDQLDELELHLRKTILDKQELTVNNAIQKKLNKIEHMKNEKIKKRQFQEQQRIEQQKLELLAQQGNKAKLKLKIDKQMLANLDNERRTNAEQIQRLLQLKDQKYADKESFRFCTEILEELLTEFVDVQIDLIEKRRLYEDVQEKKRQNAFQAEKLDKEFNERRTEAVKEANALLSEWSQRLEDLNMQELFMSQNVLNSLVKQIMPVSYQPEDKDVLQQLTDVKDFIQGAKAEIIVQTEELVKLQDQLRELQIQAAP